MKSLFIVFITLVISSQGFAQELILPGRGLGRYQYEGEKIKKSAIKKLIISTGDSQALKYYKNYEIGLGISIGSFSVGTVLLLVGGNKKSGFPLYPTSGDRLVLLGVFLQVGVTLISSISAGNSFGNAIHRFNSIQQSNLKAGVTQNGLGLTYNF